MTPGFSPRSLPLVDRTPEGGSGRILVLGETLIDIVQSHDGRHHEAPGGSPANVALTLARLGRTPELLTYLGSDEHGDQARAWLERDGVIVRGTVGARTPTARARLDRSGAASYEFAVEWMLEYEEPTPCVALHAGSYAALMEPGAETVSRAIDDHARTALITYDPNIRESLLPDAAAARDRVRSLIERADVVKLSDEDLDWVSQGRDQRSAARAVLAAGPSLVVVTQGQAGVSWLTRHGSGHVPAPRVAVVDTVGAGDTLMGALIDGLLTRGVAGAEASATLAELSGSAIGSMLTRCAQAAAITVSRPGADPPTAAEVDGQGSTVRD